MIINFNNFKTHMAILVVMCVSCVESNNLVINNPSPYNQIAIGKRCNDSNFISIVEAGTFFRNEQVSVYDRKKGIFAKGELQVQDTIWFESCTKVGKGKVFVGEIYFNEGKVIFEASTTYIILTTKEKIAFHLPDSTIFSKAILDNYNGRQVHSIENNILVFSLVLMPKGEVLSNLWVENHLAFENFTLFNVKDKSFKFFSNEENIWKFNPFFEHPVFTMSNENFFLSYPHSDKIKVYDLADWSFKTVKVKSNSIQVKDFDLSKIASNKYRHEYYQSNSFTVNMHIEGRKGYLVRIVKMNQDLINDEGLNNPPAWAKHVIEFIDMSSGLVKKSISLNGDLHNVSFSFFFDGIFYVKNKVKSNEEFVVFDGFDY